jgi:ketosteroid isomerase-like protein
MLARKITHTVLLVLVLLLHTSTIVHAYDSKMVASQGGVGQLILRLENERVQALLRGDTSFIERHYADDYITTSASGLVRNRAEVITDMKSGAIKWESMTHDDVRLRVHGDTVIVTGLDTVKGVDRGRDSTGQRRFTRVWVKQGGRWLLVSNHTTRVS